MEVAKMVCCESCGEGFVVEPRKKWDGPIEYTYFRCPHCGEAYLVSVTDEFLREEIWKYERMAGRNRISRLPEKDQIRMQRMKAQNLQRAKALRKIYGKEYV